MNKISVIIPSFNSKETIGETIKAIKNQEGLSESPEIIIVDDGSNDESLNFFNKIENIVVVTQKNSGPATARNNGAKIAKGDILVFTDSDTVPHKNWLKELTAPFKNEKIVATTGTYSIENKESKLAQLIQSEIEYKHSKYGDFVSFGGTYNLAIRKVFFEQIGGFNEEYKNASGEDVDICYKILKKGYKIKFVKEAVVGHYHPEKLAKYLKTQFKHGFWRAKLYYDYPSKVSGDNYTGNKEILETIFAGLIIISPFGYVINTIFNKWRTKKIFRQIPLYSILLLLLTESYYVNKIYSYKKENLLNLPSKSYSMIIFGVRTILRTLGFIKGLVYFQILNNKHKSY